MQSKSIWKEADKNAQRENEKADERLKRVEAAGMDIIEGEYLKQGDEVVSRKTRELVTIVAN